VNSRRITLLVAVILALGTGVLTLRYLSGLGQPGPTATPSPERQEIVVAAQDIPARSKVVPEMLKVVTRDKADIEPDAISNPKDASGTLALITIPAGSTITKNKVGKPSDVGLPVRLADGMRAFSISSDRLRAVGGLIQPGDRVDVIAIKSGETQGVAILRGILILAINTTLEQAGATPPPENTNPSTVTLAVTPQQADLLATADTGASLRLALRNPKESINSFPTESFAIAEKAAAPPPPAVPPPSRLEIPEPAPVQVIDGAKQ
jgi:pilus assembly protein CpaB